MPRAAAPNSIGGDIVASVGLITIGCLVYRFLMIPPTLPSLAPMSNPPSTTSSATLSSPTSSASLLPTLTSTPSTSAQPSSSPIPSSAYPTDGIRITPAPSTNGSHHALPPSSSSPSPIPIPPAPVSSGLAKTALYIAACRSVESSLTPSSPTPPLFTDLFASSLATPYGQSMLRAIAAASNLSSSTLATSVAIRTAYFDSSLLTAVTTPLSAILRYTSPSKRPPSPIPLPPLSPTLDLITQVVILPAGSCTRSLRLPLPAHVTVYEVDTEEVLAFREAVIGPLIDSMGGEVTLPSKARVVPVAWDPLSLTLPTPSSSAPTLSAALTAAGFTPSRPTAIICESLLPFLPEASLRRLLSSLASMCGPSSILLTDTVNAQQLRHPSQSAFLQAFAEWGMRPITGFDLPEAVFAGCGWGAKVLQEGQEWEVDWGRVKEETKHFYLKANLRGSTNDWPRTWLIHAKKV